MTTPSVLASFSARLDDGLGAILVKEARQAVRSRFVTAVQWLFLLLLVIVLGGAILGGDADGADRGAGREVFIALNVMLHAVCVLCVPLYVGARLAAERGEANVDLMFSTTLRPRQIVWGKVVSGLFVGMLAVSACAPFMALCYFLRGIDMATILLCLGFDILGLVLATVVAVFIGALPVGWVVKALVALAFAALACMSTGLVGYVFPREIARELLSSAPVAEALIVLGVVLFMVGAATGVFFMLSIALIAPPTANRALPVRAGLTGLWGASVAVLAAMLADANFRMNGFGHAAMAWGLVWCGILAVGLLVGISERDQLGARLRRTLPASPWKRKLAFLFYSGAAGGLAWTLVMAVCTLALWAVAMGWWNGMRAVMFGRPDGDTREAVWVIGALGLGLAMVLAYALLASGLRRRLFARFTRSVHTGVVAAGLMLAGVLLPLLLSFLLHGGHAYRIEKETFIHAFNPFSLVFYAFDNDHAEFQAAGLVVGAATAVMLAAGLLLSGAWLWRQARAFGSHESPSAQEVSA